MSVALLLSSVVAHGWEFSLFEALGSAIALLAGAGIACGVGLRRRHNASRVAAVGLLSAASFFWLMSILQLVGSAVSAPQKFLDEMLASPALAAVVLLLPMLLLVWCSHTAYSLRRPEVRAEFDA